jgi:hypothetical protein
VPLVIPAGSLTPGGTYQFECRAQYSGEPDATPGYAALTVVVNSPPSSGVLAASPLEGVVMDTAFELSCSGWVDDATDLPLLYSFFYKIMGDVTEFQIVSRTPSTRFAGALLPAGGGNASQVIAIAYPEDQLGAKGYAEAVVVVENPTISVAQLEHDRAHARR